MLFCSEHHRLVHEGRFRLERDYRGHWFFKRPDGRAVPACGYRAADVTDDDVESGEYLTARVPAGTHVSEDAAVSAEAAMVREPSPDVYRARPAPAEAAGVREPPREIYRVLHLSAERFAAAA